jgi:hypothetical protein
LGVPDNYSIEGFIIAPAKVRDYLLNLGHPVGGDKARFFIHFGFQREHWEVLAEALCRHSIANPIAATVQDAAGTSLVIEGAIDTPSGRRPNIRAVWLIKAAGLAPRFITAYPHRRYDC